MIDHLKKSNKNVSGFVIFAVVVFNLSEPGNIAKAIKGERVGTLIGGTWNSVLATT